MKLPPCDPDGCPHTNCDIAPWLVIATQVLLGGWDNSEGSARESLIIGLRNIDHPDCRKAVKRLKKK